MSGENTRWVLAPNPARGAEAAWWSSLIVLDGAKWYANLINVEFPDALAALRSRATNLAAEWLGVEPQDLKRIPGAVARLCPVLQAKASSRAV